MYYVAIDGKMKNKYMYDVSEQSKRCSYMQELLYVLDLLGYDQEHSKQVDQNGGQY